jgi:hypothetical protein
MHITSSLTSKTHDIHLEYDTEAQTAFLKAWRLVKTSLSDPDVGKVLKQHGHVLLPRMEAGGKVLQELATAKERQSESNVIDLNATAELAMFVANYRADVGEPVSTLPEVVLLLSEVTPYLLPSFPLPPAAEVFDQSQAGSLAWKSFELLRQKRKSDPPSLTVIAMYELWRALRQNHRSNHQIEALEQCLDLATRLFRGCMQSLAAADLLSSKVSGMRNWRQP